jgi:1-acyl-sn-glycerol-3-phosphate acyltransferase
MSGEVGQARLGAAMFARKTGTAILPIGIVGTSTALRRGSWFPKPTKVKIRIGKPLMFDRINGNDRVEKADLQAITTKCMAAVSELVKS